MIPGVETFLAAGRCFRDVLARVPAAAWQRPGLGDWDVRTLAGHTSRALITVLLYLDRPADRPADRATVESAAGYFTGADFTTSPAITSRAAAAGEALGADPVAVVDKLLAELERILPSVQDQVIESAAGGIRLGDYLPTRIFELAVHTLDLAAAAALPVTLPRDVETAALTLAAQIAAARGDGPALLLALTGRTRLPEGFSVV